MNKRQICYTKLKTNYWTLNSSQINILKTIIILDINFNFIIYNSTRFKNNYYINTSLNLKRRRWG